MARRKTGAQLIAAERERQKRKEGWTAEHDDEHEWSEMALAAVCYARNGGSKAATCPRDWPWDDLWWKPSNDRVRDLTKAGALIAAEIDRLLRKEPRA